MVSWCHDGTDWAAVEHVEVAAEDPVGERDFRVAR
jgi:hypothetical protein